MIRVHRLTYWPGREGVVLVLPFFWRPFRWFNERYSGVTQRRGYAIVSQDFYDEHLAKYEAK